MAIDRDRLHVRNIDDRQENYGFFAPLENCVVVVDTLGLKVQATRSFVDVTTAHSRPNKNFIYVLFSLSSLLPHGCAPSSAGMV